MSRNAFSTRSLRRRIRRLLGGAAGGILVLAFAAASGAGPREQAKRMHDRLAGVPPAADVLDAMAGLIQSGDPLGAADLAMQDPAFYRVSLKNFFTPFAKTQGIKVLEDFATRLRAYQLAPA